MNQENKENAKGHQTQINDSGTANIVDNTSTTNQSAQGTGNNLSINNSKYDQRQANIAGIVDTAHSGSNIQFNQYINQPPREPIKPANKIPHQGTSHFVGRDNELALIHEKFTEQNHTVAISAVAGMGGVGKTELAVKYAREHINDYPGGTCWFSVRSSNIATEILTFAKNDLRLEIPQKDIQEQPLTLQQQIDWCWRNWQPPDGVVLIVFDDVTDLENFADYLPKNNRFHVLITTRLREIDANIEEISLDVLSPEEALRLFTNIVGEKKVNKEAEIVKEICKWLGYLPLGIELVGRYITKKPPHFTLARMLEQLKQQRLEQEGINPQQKTLSTAQLGVKAAFELSWLELNEQTQKFAALLSLFAAEIFAWDWVESITQSLNWDEDDVNKAIEELYQRHLVNSLEESDIFYYKIHTLIRDFLQDKLTVLPEIDEFKRAFVGTFIEIAQTIPDSPILEEINSVKNTIPHLAEVAEKLIDTVSNEDLIWAFLGNARFYDGQGLYTLASPWYEQCVSVVKSRLGENHPGYMELKKMSTTNNNNNKSRTI
ncbi:MAG: tetratricopeptide repeat protein [Scytonematopsis contorta HA4267-MV1]|jgi:hypothetical protein|nr:tetratricopeptide repeat protein [Scytonematopsis contorta HA4267-MV1]